MNVRVAVRAIFAHIREDRLDVAFGTFHFFMHPAQRVLCFVVLEFRNRTDRAPSRCCVAVLAGDGKWAVRVASSVFLRLAADGVRTTRRLPRGGVTTCEGQQTPKEHLEYRERKLLPSRGKGGGPGEYVTKFSRDYLCPIFPQTTGLQTSSGAGSRCNSGRGE